MTNPDVLKEFQESTLSKMFKTKSGFLIAPF